MTNNLKQLRKKAGYTQKQFAEMLGVSLHHLNKIENNHKNLTTHKAWRASKLLNVSLDEIFLDKD